MYIITMDNNQQLRNVDLNLLLALHALIETGSVSESAQWLHVGQPAVSHMLKRLRGILGDPLLLRDGRTMKATPFALELQPRITVWLEEATRLVRPAPAFDPATATGIIRLAMPDLLEAALLPALLEAMQARAPGVSLAVDAMSANAVEMALTAGLIDAALGYFPGLHGPMDRELLFKAPIRCFFGPGLRFETHASLEDLAALPHVFTTYLGRSLGAVDKELARMGLARRIIASTASLLAISHILERIPAVALLPDFVEGSLARGSSIRSVPILGNLAAIPVEVMWNPKATRYDLLGFFLSVLREATLRPGP
jgi:DNA-binding transcriptional LysR family regulator